VSNHPIQKATKLFNEGWRSTGIDAYMDCKDGEMEVRIKLDIDTKTSRLLSNMSKHEESSTDSD
jgi:hypothetical protein